MAGEDQLRSGKKRRKNVVRGSNWSEKELGFFKIKVDRIENFQDFFGELPPIFIEDYEKFFKIGKNFLPPKKLNKVIEDIRELLDIDLSAVDVFERIDTTAIDSDSVSRFVKDINAVTKTHKFQESAVDDFAKTIFQIFQYDYADLSIRTREELILEMCGGTTNAKPDICIETMTSSIKLLVQEDKSYNVANSENFTGSNPEAQLIAEVIAAFQKNTKIREGRILNLPEKESQLMPCITLLGTYPTFYLFEVTKDLINAVKNGEEPDKETRVKKYQIPLRSIPLGDTMLSQIYKPKIFQCYVAFRKFVVSNN